MVIRQIEADYQFKSSRNAYLGIVVQRESQSANNAKNILLSCMASNISPESRDSLSRLLELPVNWEYLIDLATFHGVLPLVSHTLITNDLHHQVPDFQLNTIQRTYHAVNSLNLTIHQELFELLNLFDQHRIPVLCPGSPLLDEYLYGTSYFSPQRRVDILLHPEDITKTHFLLDQNGYEFIPAARKGETDRVRCRKKEGNSVIFEISRDIKTNISSALPMQRIWSRAHYQTFKHGPALILSPEDILLYLACFLSGNDTQRLKTLAEISELLKKDGASLDWDYIVASGREWQIETAVHYALKGVRNLFNFNVPLFAVESTRPDIFRRRLLEYLNSKESYVSPVTNDRIRKHISALTNALMVKNPAGVLNTLRRNTDSNERLGWLKTAAWIIPVGLSSLDRKSSLPDIKFHKIFEKYLQRKRLHQIIKYLNNIHQESDAEFEMNISGKKFIVGPGVFCPKDTYASEFLAQHLIVRSGDKVLDLGTGTGIQAIVAADRAGKVIATDINPKAVYYAEKNARLNNVKEKIELKSGDLFDPVRNERFDLIIWNAPYLPLNPHSVLEMSWCSGQNQKLIETFLRDAKTHLTERGRIEILFSSIGDLSWFINQAESSSYTVNILSSLSAGWEHLVILVLIPR